MTAPGDALEAAADAEVVLFYDPPTRHSVRDLIEWGADRHTDNREGSRTLVDRILRFAIQAYLRARARSDGDLYLSMHDIDLLKMLAAELDPPEEITP